MTLYENETQPSWWHPQSLHRPPAARRRPLDKCTAPWWPRAATGSNPDMQNRSACCGSFLSAHPHTNTYIYQTIKYIYILYINIHDYPCISISCVKSIIRRLGIFMYCMCYKLIWFYNNILYMFVWYVHIIYDCRAWGLSVITTTLQTCAVQSQTCSDSTGPSSWPQSPWKVRIGTDTLKESCWDFLAKKSCQCASHNVNQVKTSALSQYLLKCTSKCFS